MNLDDLQYEFDKVDAEFLKFHKIPNKRRRSERPDLHAFMLLDELVPSTKCIIDSSSHDIAHIGVDDEEFAKVATPEIILELTRCGVLYSGEGYGLYMFT